MALRLRRGTDSERLLITPAEGELIYATDTKLLRENVNDIENLVKSLPSGKLFEPENVAELIYDVNTKHKALFNGGHLQIDQGVLSKLSTE